MTREALPRQPRRPTAIPPVLTLADPFDPFPPPIASGAPAVPTTAHPVRAPTAAPPAASSSSAVHPVPFGSSDPTFSYASAAGKNVPQSIDELDPAQVGIFSGYMEKRLSHLVLFRHHAEEPGQMHHEQMRVYLDRVGIRPAKRGHFIPFSRAYAGRPVTVLLNRKTSKSGETAKGEATADETTTQQEKGKDKEKVMKDSAPEPEAIQTEGPKDETTTQQEKGKEKEVVEADPPLNSLCYAYVNTFDAPVLDTLNGVTRLVEGTKFLTPEGKQFGVGDRPFNVNECKHFSYAVAPSNRFLTFLVDKSYLEDVGARADNAERQLRVVQQQYNALIEVVDRMKNRREVLIKVETARLREVRVLHLVNDTQISVALLVSQQAR